jgi:predicted alpha/beta-hydrolase family hydrolase
MTERLINGPEDAEYTLLLAHGAGAGMDTLFMEHIAKGLGAEGIRVCRFEFPYMKTVRALGKKRPPNSMKILRASFLEEIDRLEGKVVIGGKSMGGRVASMLLMESVAIGAVALGYPFHPPGKPTKLRTAHFLEIKKPLLVVQGTRDPFGKPEERVEGYLPSSGLLHWILDGDHGLKPRKSSGRDHIQNLDEAVAVIIEFIQGLSKSEYS